MEQIIKLIPNRLVCDNPKCDWEDETVTLEDYEEWNNVPCPKCGQNLLTDADLLNVRALIVTSKIINTTSVKDLKAMSDNVDINTLTSDAVLKDAVGLELLFDKNDDLLILSIDTHKEIKVTDIKKIEK